MALLKAALTAALLVVIGGPPAGAATLRVGDPMPALELEDWSGAAVRVEPPVDGVLVVEIWASWCRPCREALPALAELVAQTADPRLRVAAVSIDRDRSVAGNFLAEVLPGGGVPLYHDPDAKLPATLGAPGMPTVIVAVDGVVRAVEAGFSPESRDSLRALVEGALAAATDSHPAPR